MDSVWTFVAAHGAEITFAIVAAIAISLTIAFFRRAKEAAPRRRRPCSGCWQNTFTTAYDDTLNVETIRLHSLGPIVWGRSTCKWTQDGSAKTAKYKIFGFERDKILAASYRAYDGISSDRGVFLVHIDLDGVAGTGSITGFEGGYEHLESNKCAWKRISCHDLRQQAQGAFAGA